MFPKGNIVIPSNARVILHSEGGYLHGGTIRREHIEIKCDSTSKVRGKLLQYRLRESSLTLKGPMSALQVLQAIKFHFTVVSSIQSCSCRLNVQVK